MTPARRLGYMKERRRLYFTLFLTNALWIALFAMSVNQWSHADASNMMLMEALDRAQEYCE